MNAGPEVETSVSVGERVSALAYETAWRTVRLAPESVARGAFDVLADQLWARRAGGVDVLEGNLARVLAHSATGASESVEADKLRSLSRQGVRAYLQYWCDVFRLPSMSVDQVRSRVTVEGYEHIAAAVGEGRGAVVVLPHMGNWDIVGAWLADHHGSFTTVAERLRPESLHRRFVDYRTSLGMEVLPLTGEGHVFAQLAARLRAAEVVCLLGDRDLTGSGIEVDFFGASARFPAGSAALAAATGAVLLPAQIWVDRDDDFHVNTVIHPPLEMSPGGTRMERAALMTQDLAHVFEGFIAEHPQDWHMMQRIWVDDLALDRHGAS